MTSVCTMPNPSPKSKKIDITETLSCSTEEQERLQKMAQSTTAGIWQSKRAKIILGLLEGKSVDQLVLEVRVPPLSIIRCRQEFAAEGMTYFNQPKRAPTERGGYAGTPENSVTGF
jgi:hypothetical protein